MKQVVILLLCVFVTCVCAQNSTVLINGSWKFRQKGTSRWYNASVPGTVHADLLANHLIKHPYTKAHENELRWIENEDWEYTGSFDLSSETLNQQHLELNFEGLDTYATVYLNDTLILKTNNMFRNWNVDVKTLLKAGKNNLSVVFESAVKRGRQAAAQLPYTLPEGERVFIRKAQFQFGWDWSPRYITAGITKEIKLNVWNEARLLSIHYLVNSLNDKQANCKLIYETQCSAPAEYKLSYELVGENNQLLKKTTKPVILKPGFNCDTLQCTIENPRLWWCNGLGEAFLYTLECSMLKDAQTLQKQNLSMGLRNLQFVNERDSLGNSFYFKLNGIPVFMKGANCVPVDNFESGLTEGSQAQLIKQAKEANMNMLRVWGGGVYPSDAFYELCDKNGLLVWQDFMFACAMYPGDSAFLKNVEVEIQQQVKRLRSHASLALWCGNNENNEGWFNWGWQKQFAYSETDSAQIWNNYQRLFQQLIPEIVHRYNPQTAYWPSSPSIGWGHKESLLSGDSHYWGVWWGMEPFKQYQNKVGRFMSEFGFQGMPDISTFKTFCNQKELTLNSTPVKAHQKHPKGYQTISTYMQRDYKLPANFADYAYVSQLLQRDGMKLAIEAHRLSKPSCMGTLFWQLNDCWPVTSWSAIDYYHTPKAIYFAAKKSYKTCMVSAQSKPDQTTVYLVSDSLATIKGDLVMSLNDFNGKTLWTKRVAAQLTNSEVISYTLKKGAYPAVDTAFVFLHLEFKDQTKTYASNNHFFASPKNLQLPKATIQLQGNAQSGYTLVSDVFAKDVYLSWESKPLVLNDNYFDLMPGQSKTVFLNQDIGKGATENVQIKSLNNLFK